MVKAAGDLRRGVVSMAHSWGAAALTDEKVRDIGAPTNRLIDVENGFDPITGQAIQSGFTKIDDGVRAINPLSEDSLRGNMERIGAEIASIRARVGG